MRIPSSFRLLAHTVKVKRVPQTRWKHKDCVAWYADETHSITLREGAKDTDTGHAFCHELIHACLTAMGHKLNNDEAFVDNIAGLIHQALETAKYPDPRQPRRPRKG